jgi:hypothetical protein
MRSIVAMNIGEGGDAHVVLPVFNHPAIGAGIINANPLSCSPRGYLNFILDRLTPLVSLARNWLPPGSEGYSAYFPSQQPERNG